MKTTNHSTVQFLKGIFGISTIFITTGILSIFLFLFPAEINAQLISADSTLSVKDSTLIENQVHKIKPDPFSIWIKSNSGATSLGAFYSPSINVTIKNHLFKLEGFFSSKVVYPEGKPSGGLLSLSFTPLPEIDTKVNSIHFCTGWIFPGEVWTSLTTGISISNYSIRESTVTSHTEYYNSYWLGNWSYTQYDVKWKNENKTVVGIPIEFNIHSMVHRAVGFDFGINAELNTYKSFIGASIGMRFGRMSKRISK